MVAFIAFVAMIWLKCTTAEKRRLPPFPPSVPSPESIAANPFTLTLPNAPPKYENPPPPAHIPPDIYHFIFACPYSAFAEEDERGNMQQVWKTGTPI